MIKGNYKNGFLNGEYASYSENGNIKEKAIYNGNLAGKYYSYYENGNIQKNINFKLNDNYSLAGLNFSEYYDNGNIFISGEVNESLEKIGKLEVYYKNGKKMIEIKYIKNNNDTGKYTSYYENGQIKEKVSCVGQNYYGDIFYKGTVWYYENGTIKLKSIGNKILLYNKIGAIAKISIGDEDTGVTPGMFVEYPDGNNFFSNINSIDITISRFLNYEDYSQGYESLTYDAPTEDNDYLIQSTPSVEPGSKEEEIKEGLNYFSINFNYIYSILKSKE